MAEGASPGTAGPCDPTTPSYARALDRAHNLSRLRDGIGMYPITSRAGNDRNANAQACP
jgi:hypothetical protein